MLGLCLRAIAIFGFATVPTKRGSCWPGPHERSIERVEEEEEEREWEGEAREEFSPLVGRFSLLAGFGAATKLIMITILIERSNLLLQPPPSLGPAHY